MKENHLMCSLRLGGVIFCSLFFLLRSRLMAQREHGILRKNCITPLREGLQPGAALARVPQAWQHLLAGRCALLPWEKGVSPLDSVGCSGDFQTRCLPPGPGFSPRMFLFATFFMKAIAPGGRLLSFWFCRSIITANKSKGFAFKTPGAALPMQNSTTATADFVKLQVPPPPHYS